jgi:hypothetical protein
MSEVKWKIVGVSVAGFSHTDADKPCQDSHSAASTPTGWLVCAVCDGAGSAIRSQEGSRIVADSVVNAVRSRVEKFTDAGTVDRKVLGDWVVEAIEIARIKITNLVADTEGTLADFHTTLVGAIVGPYRGLFFHIGDGAACATSLGCKLDPVVSPPENGEYANETYFVTQECWREHLRFTEFGSEYDLVVLMSDGVTPVALTSGDAQPFRLFFEPLTRYLREHQPDQGELALITTLRREALRAITGDDKSLVWAHREFSYG